MVLSRKPNATQADKESFENWKKSAQAKIKEYKSNIITEEELNQWMKENT